MGHVGAARALPVRSFAAAEGFFFPSCRAGGEVGFETKRACCQVLHVYYWKLYQEIKNQN